MDSLTEIVRLYLGEKLPIATPQTEAAAPGD